jgi:hypothetical protein
MPTHADLLTLKKTLDLFIGLSEKDIVRERANLMVANQNERPLSITTVFFTKVNQFFLELDHAFHQCIYEKIERMDSCALAEILNDLILSLATNHPKFRNKSLLKKLDYLMEFAEGYAKNYTPDDPEHDRLRKHIPQLMEVYSALNTSIQIIANISLKKTVSEYRAYLQNHLVKEGIMNSETIKIIKIVPNDHIKQQLKAVIKFKAMDDLDMRIQTKAFLDESDLIAAKEAFTVCMTKYADWFETQFIQKVTDILSLGIKPLYRVFLSQEKIYAQKVQETLSIIEPRHEME